jgi:hypothetical protein
VYCCFYFSCRTAGYKSVFGRSSDRPLRHRLSWFPCVYKQMLRWFPRFQVAATCFLCSHPYLKFLDPYFIFMYMHNNHFHSVAAHLSLNILLLLLLLMHVFTTWIPIPPSTTSQPVLLQNVSVWLLLQPCVFTLTSAATLFPHFLSVLPCSITYGIHISVCCLRCITTKAKSKYPGTP